MKKFLLLFLLSPVFLFAAQAVMNIKDVFENSKDQDIVDIQGTLVQQFDDDEFLISDKTGKIKIEFDDDHNQIPTLNSKVKIRGKVNREDSYEKPSLDVLKFKILKEQKENF